VVGHVDHGKTALVQALTGTDTDRLPEEKRRGISIALGFAHMAAGPDADIDLIDMPGHENFVRTMISGATGVDALLLVVAANEGIRPQTIEHVDIAGLLGLGRAVVAISKTDLVAPEDAAFVADQTVELLERRGIEPLRAVMTSTVLGEGIEELRQALHALAAGQCPKTVDGVAFLPIDRAFSVAGHGPVVTGTLRGAEVRAGEVLDLLPMRRPVRVRTVQVHGAGVEAAAPGQRVALNLRDVAIIDLKRGMALTEPGALAPSDWLTMSIRAIDGAPTLKNGKRLRVLLGAGEVEARLRLLDRDVLGAGEAGFAQLHCLEPVAVPAGEPVILRLASPARTVAGGRVLEPEARRQTRNSAPILRRLEELRTLSRTAMIAAEIEREGSVPTTVRRLSMLSALAKSRIVELLQTLPVVVTRSGLVVRVAHVDRLLACIPSVLGRQAAGLSHGALLSAMPGTDPAVLDEALGRLLASGAIIKRGSLLVVPRPDEDRNRALVEAELASRIAETLRRGGLSPPRPDEIVTSPQTRRAVERLLREGLIIRAVDRAKGREILFHEEAVEEARRRLQPLLQHGPGLLATEIGSVLGVSRKYTMPLLGHLDTIGFTRRVDDRRLLGVAAPATR
jgi:selenocysteine-specific elongation factor